MRRIEFPEWPEALARAQVPERLRHSFEITIRWYLSFCQRGRAEVTVQSARDFITWAVEQKRPQQWQVEHWKDAIRWFFRAAKDQGANAGGPEQPVWLPPEAKTGWPEWKVAFLTTLRRRKSSYRTEESYLVWIERFARHLGTEDLCARGEKEVAEFLDSLALNEQRRSSRCAKAKVRKTVLRRWPIRWLSHCGLIWSRSARSMALTGQPTSREFGCRTGWNGSIPTAGRSGLGFGSGQRGR